MFGKITGSTVFNMMRLNELEPSDKDPERPKRPPYIKSTEVLNLGIFKDLKRRELTTRFNKETGEYENIKEVEKQKIEAKKKKSKSRAIKNFALMSFGDEAEEDEEQESLNTGLIKNKSIYAFKDKSKKETEEDKEVREKKEEAAETKRRKAENSESSSSDNEVLQRPIHKKVEEPEKTDTPAKKQPVIKPKTKKQIKREKKKESLKSNSMLQEMLEEQRKYRSIHNDKIFKKGKKREEVTMKLLSGFNDKMKKSTYSDKSKSSKENKEKIEKTVEEMTEEEKMMKEYEESDDEDIWNHKFVATDQEISAEALRLNTGRSRAKDALTMTGEDFDIHDPRNSLNKRRRERDDAMLNKKFKKSANRIVI